MWEVIACRLGFAPGGGFRWCLECWVARDIKKRPPLESGEAPWWVSSRACHWKRPARLAKVAPLSAISASRALWQSRSGVARRSWLGPRVAHVAAAAPCAGLVHAWCLMCCTQWERRGGAGALAVEARGRAGGPLWGMRGPGSECAWPSVWSALAYRCSVIGASICRRGARVRERGWGEMLRPPWARRPWRRMGSDLP